MDEEIKEGIEYVCKVCGKPTIRPKGPKLNYCPPCHVKTFLSTYCCHTKGKWAGQPFKVLPWQEDAIDRAFGTLKPNGLRKYRIVYIEIPKKNGKSELASGLALYGLKGEGEPGCEIYSAAGDREQASLIYYPATYMVENNHKLKSGLKVLGSKRRIIDYKNNGFYQVLSAEAFTKHGINPSLILFDEIHAQPNRELWDVLTEGTDIAREQQLVFVLTTAGLAEMTSIGYEVHNHAMQCIRDPEFDPGFLPIVYAANVNMKESKIIPKKDKDNPNGYDWEDPKVWKRCNPSLGHVFELENLETHYQNVIRNPARINNFQRFRLNIWVSQVSRYIPMDMWGKCSQNYDFMELFKGKPVWGGLDLSSSIDLTALALVGILDKKFYSFVHYYCPEATIIHRSKKDRVPYDRWSEQGYVTLTPGNSIDYAFIRRDIVNISNIFQIKEIGFDPYRADELKNTLIEKHKVNMIDHRQTYTDMSEPTKHLYESIVDEELYHDNNPVTNWCIDNLAVKTDANENMRPVKDESADRIDGAVALIMALGRCLEREQYESVYEKRGIVLV